MKFDTIVIGGGLSGLTAANVLAAKGQHVALVTTGQNTLHFGTGSFDLLGYGTDGEETVHPLDAISSLAAEHPYRKLGTEAVTALTNEAKALLENCGIKTKGTAQENHYRVTPMGTLKPTWLTVEGMATAKVDKSFAWKKPVLVNIAGFLDLPTNFLLAGLQELGIECPLKTIRLDAFDHARRSPTEMRATNVAKVIHDQKLVEELAAELNTFTGYDVILFPAVAGLFNASEDEQLRKAVKTPIEYVTPMPPSVMGIRVTHLLSDRFRQLGGILLVSNKIKSGVVEDGSVRYVESDHLPDEQLVADNYILASGSFMSNGVRADYEHVYEPIFGLDVEAPANRYEWYSESAFKAHPYMQYGVSTANDFHAKKGGKAISNLYAVGSVLLGHDPIKLADGAGVSLLTALQAAKNILK